MKTTKFAHLCGAVCLALTTVYVSSCTKDKVTTEDAQTYLQSHVDSLQLSTDSILDMKYTYQYLKSDSTVADSINATICQFCINGERDTDMPNAIRNAFAEEYSKNAAEIAELYNSDDEFFANLRYDIERTGCFDAASHDTVLIYNASYYTYTGGAHGSYNSYTLNFSLNTGRRIEVKDVVDVNREEEILALMEAKIVKDHGCANTEELMEKTGILALGDLYLTDNFSLGKDSITFCFGQYEIAPYASGITYVSLALKDVR